MTNKTVHNKKHLKLPFQETFLQKMFQESLKSSETIVANYEDAIFLFDSKSERLDRDIIQQFEPKNFGVKVNLEFEGLSETIKKWKFKSLVKVLLRNRCPVTYEAEIDDLENV